MYLMSYFRDEDQTMRLAEGTDILHYTDLNEGKPVLDLRDRGKIIRDPYIFRDNSGMYRLFFTDNWYSNTLGYSESEDGIQWKDPVYISVMGENEDVANCWAPELCWDQEKEAYMLFWSSSFYSKNTENRISNRIWYCHTKDFINYTEAKLLFDPGYQVIDASILFRDGKYYMAFKDERGHNAPGTKYAAIRVACAEHAEGPYGEISDLLTEFRSEGPLLIEDGGWVYLFYDAFGSHAYKGMRTKDMKVWEDISEEMQFPQACKHLCIMKRGRSKV